MSDQIKSVARLIVLVEWGFDQMQKQAETTERSRTEKQSKHPAAAKAAGIGRRVLGFVGAAGDAYFRTYSELKKGK